MKLSGGDPPGPLKNYFFLKLEHLLAHFEKLYISLTERPYFKKCSQLILQIASNHNFKFADRYTNSAPLMIDIIILVMMQLHVCLSLTTYNAL